LRALLKGAAMVNWDRLLAEAKTFFSSGLFFMLVGGLIRYFGYRLSNDPFTRSAFVFLVVILGLRCSCSEQGLALPVREQAVRSRWQLPEAPACLPWFSALASPIGVKI
jgi:hypothetical protein